MNGTAEDQEFLLAMFGSESVRADNVTLQQIPFCKQKYCVKERKIQASNQKSPIEGIDKD